jgi:hypothetical protein
MSHELKELTSQEIELVAGGSGLSPAQQAETVAAITQPGESSTPESWTTKLIGMLVNRSGWRP